MEPRARSYDHQRQEKSEKGKFISVCKLASVSRFVTNPVISIRENIW